MKNLHEAIQHFKNLMEFDPQFYRASSSVNALRRIDDKVMKPLRDRMPARRERMQRNRKHKFAPLGRKGALKRLSTRMPG